jgi:hypothetical protein
MRIFCSYFIYTFVVVSIGPKTYTYSKVLLVDMLWSVILMYSVAVLENYLHVLVILLFLSAVNSRTSASDLPYVWIQTVLSDLVGKWWTSQILCWRREIYRVFTLLLNDSERYLGSGFTTLRGVRRCTAFGQQIRPIFWTVAQYMY